MGKPTGFMEIKREKPAERDPLTRLKDWKEYSAPFSEEASKRQGRGVWIAVHRFARSVRTLTDLHPAVRFTT
ncbi:hypothetical protein QI003_13410 [Bacillus stercoris]|uniref:hypothetical protein n=1 Tax=Bacillus stercoris TaxID=2054641 RepID=UPI00249B0FD7|nr:hypothetical protein [Bacillus stercoris]WGV97847.1 hypothetical protein QI003_13410 [Bacillus stercoris]